MESCATATLHANASLLRVRLHGVIVWEVRLEKHGQASSSSKCHSVVLLAHHWLSEMRGGSPQELALHCL